MTKDGSRHIGTHEHLCPRVRGFVCEELVEEGASTHKPPVGQGMECGPFHEVIAATDMNPQSLGACGSGQGLV